MEVDGVKIEFLGHSGFLITNESGKRLIIDPYNVSDKVTKADMILLTHSHYDHCSIKDLIKVAGKGTVLVVPADVQSKVAKLENVEMQVIASGDEMTFGKIKIEALPAYNVDKDFHTKADDWLGFLIKFDKVIVYHAGDTDLIPEMKRLSGYGKHGNKFIALLPVSGTYVMNPSEAAEAASLVNADIAIPMHYGAGVAGTIEDAQKFVECCEKEGIHAEILEKI
ncbi:MAG: MBL fold metallo-hydrolase [Nanoarchaeota archaeon]|nr:MBL fold metallo-hydrolase [Nanoarchaeota archaeon]